MGRWHVSLIAAVVTTAVAVAINIATELKTEAWAWIAVGVLTIALAGVTVLMHRLDTRTTTDQPPAGVNQTAVAFGDATIQQAGGDIHNGPGFGR